MFAHFCFVGIVFCIKNAACDLGNIEPGQCVSRFDYDYKVLEKLSQFEREIKELKQMKMFEGWSSFFIHKSYYKMYKMYQHFISFVLEYAYDQASLTL
jgi:hypothetical protein